MSFYEDSKLSSCLESLILGPSKLFLLLDGAAEAEEELETLSELL